MVKLVLLDRDGVINKELGNYVAHVKDFEILPHVVANLKKLCETGIKLAIITNQGGIAKGLYNHEILAQIHQKMLAVFDANKIHISQIYYCPHHPDFGNCLCRKPDALMLEKTMAKLNIQPKFTVFIGDTQRDMDAAEKAGVKGYKIASNQDWTAIVSEITNEC